MSFATYRDEHSKELREVLKLTVIAVKAAGRLVVAKVLTPTPVYAPELTFTSGHTSEHAAVPTGTGENAAYPTPVQGGI